MKYFWATIRHKWFVFLASFKVGLPLWRAIIHDLSKFTFAELPHYDRQFFGDKSDPAGFAKAWLHHYHHNNHHWEHWIIESIHSSSPTRDGCIENNCLAMPDVCIREMIADWLGASMAYTNSWNMHEWLDKNLSKMQLHSDTKRKILSIMYDCGIYAANWKEAHV